MEEWEMERRVSLERNTNETKIKLTLNLDGSGSAKVKTGIGFFDRSSFKYFIIYEHIYHISF